MKIIKYKLIIKVPQNLDEYEILSIKAELDKEVGVKLPHSSIIETQCIIEDEI